MSYPESVEYLYALGNELKAGAKFGLERMQILLAELGHPERDQNFVHVAGTNGKGSTSAMMASALQSAGFKTGLYTSPHLIEPTERIQLNGRPVGRADFAAAFGQVHEAAEALLRDGRIDAHPSYFETVTAMAFLLFRDRTDMVVIEVGLGGRLDATNVIEPKLCVITPVSYDHEAFLGNTLESIAGEKAGIMKRDVPVVVARQRPRAAEVIFARARELSCEYIEASAADLTDTDVTATGSSFRLHGERYACGLAGRHQIENAVTAIYALRKLGVNESATKMGLRNARWPGRLEYVQRAPDFVLDGAHNPAGADALAAYIREFCAGRPVWLVFGAMRDKAVGEIADILFPLAERVIVTAPDMPRALRPEALLETISVPRASIAHTVAAAIDAARKAPSDAIVFFTGSLYLVGETRKLLVREAVPVS